MFVSASDQNAHNFIMQLAVWSRSWRLRPQTPSLKNALTTTEKGF